MEENLKVKQVIVAATFIIGLISWLFVTQGGQIKENRHGIEQNRLNNKAYETDIKYIREDIKEIKSLIIKLQE